MRINLVVHKVHANDTSNVTIMAAGRHRICSLLGSADNASWYREIVVVGEWILA